MEAEKPITKTWVAARPGEWPRDRTWNALLAVLLVFAAGLRIYQLNAGLWLDEILTDVLYARNPVLQIITTYDSENQHFLYSLLAHAAYQLFGPSPWALRLPAVLFGVGSIWAVYLFGRRVTGHLEAFLAAALLTFSYQHIWFSQNARGYSGLLFWSLMSSWLLMAGLQDGRRRFWIGYACAAALGLYTHMTMLFVVTGQAVIAAGALFLSYRERNERRTRSASGSAIGFLGAACLSLLLYAPVLPQLLGGLGRETSLVAAWKNPLWTLGELVRGLDVSFAGAFVGSAALCVVAVGLISYLLQQPAVVALLVVPVVSGTAVVFGLGHHLWPRFFFFALGFGALVLIRGAMQTGRLIDRLLLRRARIRRIRPGYAGVTLCCGLIIASAISVPKVYGPKQDYAGAMDFVNARRQPGDAVATASIAALPYQGYYHVDWDAVDGIASFNALRARAARTWFVYAFPPVLESAMPEVANSIKQDFQLMATFEGTVSGGTVYVLRADRPAAAAGLR